MAKIKVCEISGMGGREHGGYEWGCQVICARALRFLEQSKESGEFPQFHTYKNIVGILSSDNAAAKKMDEYIMQHEKLREYGITGAMHQFGVAHAMKIFELGRDGYFAALREGDGENTRGDDDFYEFEEDDAFPANQEQTVGE